MDKEKSIFSVLIEFLNECEETTISDIVAKNGLNASSITTYIHRLELSGYIYKFGSKIIIRTKVPQLLINDFAKSSYNLDTYHQDRLDFLKNKPLKEYSKNLSVLECLYLLQDKMGNVTADEFSELTGKDKKLAYTIFPSLRRMGYLSKNGRIHTILKPIPVVENQSEFLKINKYSNLRWSEKSEEKPKPAIKSSDDLLWINRLVSTMYFDTAIEKINAIAFLKESALCL